MAIIDWECKFKKQLELNKFLLQRNVEILRNQRRNFMEKLYWTQDFPKQEGWYWIRVGFDGYPRMEHFWPSDKDGKLCAIDDEYDEYGEECFQGYWFSNEPIKEPENM